MNHNYFTIIVFGLLLLISNSNIVFAKNKSLALKIEKMLVREHTFIEKKYSTQNCEINFVDTKNKFLINGKSLLLDEDDKDCPTDNTLYVYTASPYLIKKDTVTLFHDNGYCTKSTYNQNLKIIKMIVASFSPGCDDKSKHISVSTFEFKHGKTFKGGLYKVIFKNKTTINKIIGEWNSERKEEIRTTLDQEGQPSEKIIITYADIEQTMPIAKYMIEIRDGKEEIVQYEKLQYENSSIKIHSIYLSPGSDGVWENVEDNFLLQEWFF